MNEPPNTELVRIKYQKAFDEHGPTVSALFFPKGRQDERFTSLCQRLPANDFSLLDYGCGFGDLCGFLQRHYLNFSYTGVDLVPEFIAEASQRYPIAKFSTIVSPTEIVENFDYVLAAGVFNLLYNNDPKIHQTLVFETLSLLFKRANKALMINFMTDRVDFQQPGSYHQNVIELYTFASQNLSPRLLLDQSYMPYEYSLLIFKDASILRPDNIYPPRP